MRIIMGNYSKLIGAIVGAALGMLVAFGVVPDEWATAENTETLIAAIGTIVGLGAAIATYFFPKNKPTL
jgi:protein-S-isoprenylcysteine O-methyltransferase Ste14